MSCKNKEPVDVDNLENNVDMMATVTYGMMQEIKGVKERVKKIPGAPQPLEAASATCYSESPFEDKIARSEVPKKFRPLVMIAYDGTTDQTKHVSLYEHKVETSSVPEDKKELCMCKGFGSTLTGAALTWYINIARGSVKSFADLINLFNL